MSNDKQEDESRAVGLPPEALKAIAAIRLSVEDLANSLGCQVDGMGFKWKPDETPLQLESIFLNPPFALENETPIVGVE